MRVCDFYVKCWLALPPERNHDTSSLHGGKSDPREYLRNLHSPVNGVTRIHRLAVFGERGGG